jgi:hypothetical protein
MEAQLVREPASVAAEAPPSEASRETARNILLSRSIELASQAIAADNAGNIGVAFELYSDAVQLLMLLVKNEETETRRTLFRAKATELLGRAEEIKKILATRSQAKVQAQATAPASDEEQEEPSAPVECEVVLNVDGVTCYSMVSTTERHVIATGSMQLLQTDDPSGLHLLRLGEFEFPLLPAVPCLRVARGFYMLPMPEGNVVYGFVFPSDIPDPYLTIFESKLAPLCTFKTESEGEEFAAAAAAARAQAQAGTQITVAAPAGTLAQPLPLSTRVASTVFTGSQYVVAGIQSGTQTVGSAIQKGGELLKSKLKAAETPAQVNQKLANTIHVASKASPYVVKVSRGIITGLVLVAEKIGEAAAEGIMRTPLGVKINSGSSAIGHERIEAAKEVGKAGLAAVVNVWEALEESGRALVSQLSQSTVNVVEHKYGKDAGQLTGESLSVAVDLVETAYNLKQVGVKKLAKRVVKSTGKNYVIQMIADQPAIPALEGPPARPMLANVPANNTP